MPPKKCHEEKIQVLHVLLESLKRGASQIDLSVWNIHLYFCYHPSQIKVKRKKIMDGLSCFVLLQDPCLSHELHNSKDQHGQTSVIVYLGLQNSTESQLILKNKNRHKATTKSSNSLYNQALLIGTTQHSLARIKSKHFSPSNAGLCPYRLSLD